MADAEVAQVTASQPAGTESGPSSHAVRQTVPDQPPAISNKLGLDEAFLHRRSLLVALILLKDNRRSHETDAALHMLLCSLSYRQIDAATLKQTRLTDVVQALRQHPHRPVADLALGLLQQPLWKEFAGRQPPLPLLA